MADLATNLSSLVTAIGTDIKTLLAQDGKLSELTTKQKASLVVAINEVDAAVKAIDVKSIIDDGATDATHAWSAQKVAAEILTKTNAVKDALLNGAGEAYDTLKELADLITTNKDAITALQEIAGKHVRFDQDQELTPEQKTQALKNIGGASVEALATTDAKAQKGVDDAAAAKQVADSAEGKATANATAIGTLTALKTTEKTNLVGAVNEVKSQADKGVQDAAAASAAASAADGKAQKAQGDVDALKAAVGDTTTDLVQIYNTARNGGAAA